MDRLFDGVGSDAAVFHAAAVIHPRRSVRELFDVNVAHPAHAGQGARGGAARFVHVSSNSPFGVNPGPDDVFTEESPYNPYMGYGRSKQEAEQLVKQAHDRGDLGTVTVRAPWFYGPYQPLRQSRFFIAIRKGRFPRWRRHPEAQPSSSPTTWCRVCCGRRCPTRRPATPTGGRRPALRAARDPRHGAPGIGRRGLAVSGPERVPLPPWRPGGKAGGCPAPGRGRYSPGPACAGGAEPHHRLRHHLGLEELSSVD